MAARLSDEQKLLRQISEKDWQRTVEQLARYQGWLIYHAPDNMPRRSKTGYQYVQDVRAGFPDLVLVRGERIIFAELKRETGRVSDAQTEWLDALRDTGVVEVYIWRPSDRDTVGRTLTAGVGA